jgi:hypothetical protein
MRRIFEQKADMKKGWKAAKTIIWSTDEQQRKHKLRVFCSFPETALPENRNKKCFIL